MTIRTRAVCSEAKQKMLILEWHHLGDAVLSLPFIKSALKKYDVTVCCRPQCAEIFRWVLPDNRVIRIDPPWEILWKDALQIESLFLFFRWLINLKPEFVVCGWSDTRAHLIGLISGAKIRVGFEMNEVNYFAWSACFQRSKLIEGRLLRVLCELLTGKKLINKKIQRKEFYQHHLKDWEQLSRACYLDWNAEFPWIDESDFEKQEIQPNLKVLERALGSRKKEHLWLIHPRARVSYKHWPDQYFIELINKMRREKDCRIIVVLGPKEKFPLSENSVYELIKTRSITELAYVISKCDGIICLDSLAGHIAAGMKKLVISLFGKMPYCWFSPYGNEKFVVGGRKTGEVSFQSSLLEDVEVKEVLDLVKEMDFNNNYPV